MRIATDLKISIQSHSTYILILLGTWVLSSFLINPIGEFPLNDDWAYALSIKWFHETGQLKIANWGEMTLVGHLLWGGLFTYFTDFSHSALRFSTIVLGFGLLITLYSIAIEVGFSKPISLLMSLILLVNPIFMALSNTYMTDVPFAFFTAISLLFYLKAHNKESYLYLALAISTTVISLLYRQLAFVLPLSWFIAQLILPTRSFKNGFWIVSPLALVLLSYFLFTFFMTDAGLLQPRFNDKLNVIQTVLSSFSIKSGVNIAGYICITISYMGLFFSPFLILRLKQSWVRYKWLLTCYTILVSAVLIVSEKTLPALDNIWIDFGVGPTTLPDFYDDFNHTPPYTMHAWARGLLTIIAVFFGGILAIQILETVRTKLRTFQVLLSVLATIIYLAPFMLVGIYDRYLIPLFFLGILLLSPPNNKTSSKNNLLKAALYLAPFFVFSVSATHDYLSWNRVRWQALHEFEKSNGKGLITGGVEYDAWNYYSDDVPQWWEEIPTNYAIVFSTNNNEQIIASYSYNRWLPGENSLHIIQQLP